MSPFRGRAGWAGEVDRARAALRLAESTVRSRVLPADRAVRTSRAAFYRGLWAAAAADLGAHVRALPDDVLEVSRGGRSVRVRETDCGIEPPETRELAGDGVRAARLLVEAGLPVPPQQVVTLSSLADVRAFASTTPGPYVVKPAERGVGGRGVTTHVRTWSDLRRAAVTAAAAGARDTPGGLAAVPLLVQRQTGGTAYRLLYLDGVLVDAVRREAPTVVADGLRTVGSLVTRANDARRYVDAGRGARLVYRDRDLDRTLAAQGLQWRSVPAAGRVVALKTTIDESAPMTARPARHEVGAALVEEGGRAAAALGLRLAGVDVLTDDAAVSLAESGGCVLRVDPAPGLAMHYHGLPGQVPVATAVLRGLLDPSAPHGRSRPPTSPRRPSRAPRSA